VKIAKITAKSRQRHGIN